MAAKISDAARLYDTDFCDWCMTTAQLLRAGRLDEADIEHIAEEIEDLGKSQFREFDNRTIAIMMHLLKLRYQPEKRSPSWERTINTQRIRLHRLFRYNPSLRRLLRGAPARLYKDAIDDAVNETGLPIDAFPADCPFTPAEVFGEELLAD